MTIFVLSKKRSRRLKHGGGALKQFGVAIHYILRRRGVFSTAGSFGIMGFGIENGRDLLVNFHWSPLPTLTKGVKVHPLN